MATNLNFINYLVEQLNGLQNIAYKKMFGEYIIYSNLKPVLLVCNNTVFVKILPETKEIFKENNEQTYPYNGAKLHYVFEEIENKEKFQELVILLEKHAPTPKPKKINKKCKK